MDRATAFAIDFTSFELAMKVLLFFGDLTRAHKADQLPPVMLLEIVQ